MSRVLKEYWPSHWDVRTLDDICTLQIGRTPRRGNQAYWSGGTHTWITIADLTSRIITSSKEQVTDRAIEDGRVVLVPQGSLLMSFKLTIGKLAFAGKDLFTNEAIVALNLKPEFQDEIDPEYLYWVLQSVPLEKESIFAVKGRTLNKDKLKRIEIPVPTLPEQRRIVVRIEALLGEVRAMRKLQEEITADVNQLMDAVRGEQFYRGTDLPSGWQMRRIDSFAEVNPRRPLITRADGELTSFVPMAALDEVRGEFSIVESRPFSEVKRGFTYFEENDVVFAKITPSMQNGKSAVARNLIDGFGFGTTEFHVIRSNGSVLPDWIHQFLRQKHFLAEAMGHFRGAVGQQRVPPEFLAGYEIPLPYPDDLEKSILIQTQVIEHMKLVQSEIWQIRDDSEAEKTLLESIEQAILTQAFRGEL